MTWTATRAIEASSRLGEGPWWDAECRRLIWVDITAGAVQEWNAETKATRATRVGETVGFVVGRDRGGYLAGTAAGLLALDDELRPLGGVGAPPDLDGTRRINDGACDPAGRVLFGTVDPSGESAGTLWSFGVNGSFTPLVKGVAMSNGIGFSPDGEQLYYVDTATHQVDRFDYDVDTGRVAERQPLRRIPADVGLPDGLAIDEEGCVWVALWGACQVWRLAADGELVGVVEVPASRTTSCAFGGSRRDLLYVTTACEGGDDLDVDRDGAPGAVFAAHVEVAGAPVWRAGA